MRQLCPIAIFAFVVLRAHGTTNEIPFEYREGLLWIKATVPHSSDPLNLLLDTGAGASVLDTATAKKMKLELGRPVNVRGVESTLAGHWLKLPSVTADGVPLPANYLAVNLQKLSKSCASPVTDSWAPISSANVSFKLTSMPTRSGSCRLGPRSRQATK